jgi:hypothetical protein
MEQRSSSGTERKGYGQLPEVGNWKGRRNVRDTLSRGGKRVMLEGAKSSRVYIGDLSDSPCATA